MFSLLRRTSVRKIVSGGGVIYHPVGMQVYGTAYCSQGGGVIYHPGDMLIYGTTYCSKHIEKCQETKTAALQTVTAAATAADCCWHDGGIAPTKLLLKLPLTRRHCVEESASEKKADTREAQRASITTPHCATSLYHCCEVEW